MVRVRPELAKLKDDERNAYFTAWKIVAGSLSRECAHLVLKVVEYNPYDAYHAIIEKFDPPLTSSHLAQRHAFYKAQCHFARDVLKFISDIDMASDKLQQQVLNHTAKFFTRLNKKKYTVQMLDPNIMDLLKELMELEKLAVLLGGLPSDFEVITILIENDRRSSYKTAVSMIQNHANKQMDGNDP